ncbi:MAG: hypothetical protein ACREIK_09560, partial [Nitrospiraceae bacterium]
VRDVGWTELNRMGIAGRLQFSLRRDAQPPVFVLDLSGIGQARASGHRKGPENQDSRPARPRLFTRGRLLFHDSSFSFLGYGITLVIL